VNDQWAAGATYEEFMGRWSRPLARQFVDWLECPHGIDWLELGCGTGSLTAAICEQANPKSIVACDPASSLLAFAKDHVTDPRVTFVPAGADDFPMPAGERYMSVASLLALNFFPSPEATLQRVQTAAGAGATVAACVWDYSAGMQFLRVFWDAAREVTNAACHADEGARFPICTRANLLGLFRRAGLDDVICDALEVPTVFRDFDNYWHPLTAGTGPAPAFVQTLSENDRELLRAKLQERLTAGASGVIALTARAWAVRGGIKRRLYFRT
jgi:trans-aconitate methyltransferase